MATIVPYPEIESARLPADAGATASADELERVGPGSPLIVLCYRCLHREHGRLIAHRPPPGGGASATDVHQMRIATRRLRVALRTFERLLPPEAQDIARELRWLGRSLGEVRDLDVYADRLRDYLQTGEDESADSLSRYELDVRRKRALAHASLAELFATKRYARLMVALEKLLDGAPSAGALRRWRSLTVRDGAKRALRKSRKRVLKLGRKLAKDASAKDLHRLRIRVKRLRYELEFFAEAYPRLADAAKAAKALQDALGAHQDAHAAAAALARDRRRVQREPDAGNDAAVAALGRWRAEQRAKAAAARDEWPQAWREFTAAAKAIRASL